MDLPLTFQQTIALKIANQRTQTPDPTQTESFFARKRFHGLSLKKVRELAQPRKNEENLRGENEEHLFRIITKCDRLKSKLLTNKKL